MSDTSPAPVSVTAGDVIRIVPDKGSERLMLVAHVEHHIITLSDLPERARVSELPGAGPDWCGGMSVDEYVRSQGR